MASAVPSGQPGRVRRCAVDDPGDRGVGAAGRHDQVAGMRAGRQLGQQVGQCRRLIAEQADQARSGRHLDALPAQPAGAIEPGLALRQIGLAQQATGGRREAGMEETLDQASGRAGQHRRGQAMAALRERFRCEVFEIDPGGLPAPGPGRRGEGRLELRLQFTAERFDHGIAGLRRHLVVPGQNLDARLAGGCHPLQGRGVVDPEPHLFAAIGQLDRQPPAHADVAVVVDDLAENVPEHRDGIERRLWLRHNFASQSKSMPQRLREDCVVAPT